MTTPLDVVGVHLVGGLVGTLGIGLIASAAAPTAVAGLFYGGGLGQLGRQMLGALVVLVFAFTVSGALALGVDRLMGFRIDPEHEVSGLTSSSTPRPPTTSTPWSAAGPPATACSATTTREHS